MHKLVCFFCSAGLCCLCVNVSYPAGYVLNGFVSVVAVCHTVTLTSLTIPVLRNKPVLLTNAIKVTADMLFTATLYEGAPRIRHDLVVGGSGMLSECVLRMAQSGRSVSVVCRNPRRLELLQLQENAPADSIHVISVDYTKLDILFEALVLARQQRGCFDRIVCWAHTDIAPEVPLKLASFADSYFCHILSSSVGNPSTPNVLKSWCIRFSDNYPDLRYQTVILGFKENRWLNNQEISSGIWDAMTNASNSLIIGQIEPWSMRPG